MEICMANAQKVARPTSAPEKPATNAPIHTIRHRRLRASIWQNTVDTGVFHSVTVTRGYKDGDTWRDSHSFGYDDLTVVAKLLLDCHTYITSAGTKEGNPPPPTAGE